MSEDPTPYPSLPDPWWRESAPSSDTPPGDVRHFETFRDDPEFFPDLGLSCTQLRAIELTVQGYSDSHIAEKLGINRRTVWRWKNFDDCYRRALDNVRMQTHATVIDRYATLLVRSTNIFAKMLQDPAEEKQFRAAQTLICMAGCFRPIATRLQNHPPPQPQRPDNDEPEPEPEPQLEPKVG